MKDLLNFDKMITPSIIRILYFLGLIAVVVCAGISLYVSQYWMALATLIFGAIAVRVYCELMILFFRINQNLIEINQQTKNRP